MSLIKPFPWGKGNGSSPARVHMEDPESVTKASQFLSDCLSQVPSFMERPKVIVCIGSDRSTGDSLGPLVGSYLKKNPDHSFKIMGTLENPVHATNLTEHLNVLGALENPLVIAIDACLGNLDSVGFINVARGPLKPGAGVNKSLPPVGELHITGIVNVGGFMEYFVLQNTRLNTVMKMAEIISESLIQSYKGLLLNESASKCTK